MYLFCDSIHLTFLLLSPTIVTHRTSVRNFSNSESAASGLTSQQKTQVAVISTAWIAFLAVAGFTSTQTASNIAVAGPLSNKHSW